MQRIFAYRAGCVALGLVMLAVIFAGCGSLEGDQDINMPPVVRLVTVPLDSTEFSFAPTLYWTGNDPDGFVEYYSYADITDSAAFADAEAPVRFYEQIPEDAWIDTVATQTRIFLKTETGEVMPHVFYVRCFDNEGLENDSIAYRTFFRSNQPPDIPRIGISGATDDEMDENVYIPDTLFSGSRVTNTWPGIQFNWNSSDPDDQSLYKIPLQFQPVLVKAPGDTIFVGDWQDEQDIILSDLETGFYSLYVWVRDDAFSLSSAPARIEFNVIRPTFEHDVLMVVETPVTTPNERFPEPDSLVNDEGTGFYNRLFEDIKDQITNADLVMDGVDVKFLHTPANSEEVVIPKSLIHQYKMVIFACDQIIRLSFDESYRNTRNRVLVDYLRVGGRLWYQGRTLGDKVLPSNDLITYNVLLQEFMAVEAIQQPDSMFNGFKVYAEFIGTIPARVGYPSLQFDTTRYEENWIMYTPGGFVDSLQRGQSGVERIERGLGSITTQYFDSYTSDYTGVMIHDQASIVTEIEIGDEIEFYPPTPQKCFIRTTERNVYAETVDSLINVTRRDAGGLNWIGEVNTVNDNFIEVGYTTGEPWLVEDEVIVNYEFNPLSDMHLKPVEVTHEQIQGIDFVLVELSYRTALSTFSYYFMDYEAAQESWIIMLDWFLNPMITSQ